MEPMRDAQKSQQNSPKNGGFSWCLGPWVISQSIQGENSTKMWGTPPPFRGGLLVMKSICPFSVKENPPNNTPNPNLEDTNPLKVTTKWERDMNDEILAHSIPGIGICIYLPTWKP